MGGLKGVRAVLAGDHDQDAGPAVDESVAEGWCGRLDDVGHIGDPHRRASRGLDLAGRHIVGGQGLAARFDRHALVWGVYEPRADHAGRPLDGVEDVQEPQIAVGEVGRAGADLDAPRLTAIDGHPGDAGG